MASGGSVLAQLFPRCSPELGARMHPSAPCMHLAPALHCRITKVQMQALGGAVAAQGARRLGLGGMTSRCVCAGPR